MIKKYTWTILMVVALAGMVWAGESAKANEQEITLPAIKISKTRADKETQNYALGKKDKGRADQSSKKEVNADKLEGSHSM